jgi:hypothetical protein
MSDHVPAENTERELLIQTLRLQEQASVSNISQLVECRKQLELARLQNQILTNTADHSADPQLRAEVSELRDQETLNLENLTYDYLMLLEEERQWLMMFVRCFDEMNFPDGGVWKTFFTEEMEEQDFAFRKLLNARKEKAEAVRAAQQAAQAEESHANLPPEATTGTISAADSPPAN